MSDVTVRVVDCLAEPHTLDAMEGVIERAFGSTGWRQQVEWYVAAQPDAVVVAEQGGVVVGTAFGIAYPDAGYGWIGLVGTDPGALRRGIGTSTTELVAEVLAGHGCASVLDASTSGAPVYERMGFVDHGVTTVVHAPEHVDADASSVLLATDADLADLIAFDAATFGARRDAVLRTLMRQFPQRVGLVRRGGAVTGYVVGQVGAIGPFMAQTGDDLTALAAFARGLSWDGAPRVSVPPGSEHLTRLVDLGFEPARTLRHMRRGIEVLPGRQHLVAGRVSLGVG